MSICDADLLNYGLELANIDSEISWRASISRSYYAAYHRANFWHSGLPSAGIAPAGMGVHATLIKCLTTPSVTGKDKITSMSIGYMLNLMKSSRQKADYELTESVDQAEALTVAQSAAMLLQKAV